LLSCYASCTHVAFKLALFRRRTLPSSALFPVFQMSELLPSSIFLSLLPLPSGLFDMGPAALILSPLPILCKHVNLPPTRGRVTPSPIFQEDINLRFLPLLVPIFRTSNPSLRELWRFFDCKDRAIVKGGHFVSSPTFFPSLCFFSSRAVTALGYS